MADMASELEAAAFRLRRAGGNLARELTRAMRDGVQPVPDEIRAGLKPKLPDRYAEVLDADLDLTVKARNQGGDAILTVTATTRGAVERRRLRRLDRGLLVHPYMGNRKHWYNQQVPPGWFTGPCEDVAPQVRAALEQALADVAAKAEGA